MILEVDAYIENWASDLAIRLTEVRYMDVDVIKAAMKTHLKSAIIDCMDLKIGDAEKKINSLKEQIADRSISNQKKWHLMQQIGALNPKKKQANFLKFSIKHHDEYRHLKNLISQKFGKEQLMELIAIIEKTVNDQ